MTTKTLKTRFEDFTNFLMFAAFGLVWSGLGLVLALASASGLGFGFCCSHWRFERDTAWT
jgi:hypothetical protein